MCNLMWLVKLELCRCLQSHFCHVTSPCAVAEFEFIYETAT
jgi:hypothetical protein